MSIVITGASGQLGRLAATDGATAFSRFSRVLPGYNSARATGKIREALDHLGTIKVVGPGGIELAVDLRRADEGTIAHDLSELFLQLGAAAASKKSGVVFLLDEVQFVSEIEYRLGVMTLELGEGVGPALGVTGAGLLVG